MHYYTDVLRKYAVFNGRAPRAEYWFFVLINAIIGMVINVVGVIAHASIIYWLYALAMVIPSLAVGVRRLHDAGYSGWWMFLLLVPIVGPIVLLLMCMQRSEEGANAYGPNPYGTVSAVAAVGAPQA